MEPPESTPANDPGPGSTDGYEFSPEQDVLLARLAVKMRFVGLFALGIGIAAILAGAVRRDPGPVFGGALYAVIGLWTERAGRSFRNVAATKGHDIHHLMHALSDLRRLYTVQYWVCLLALAATLVLLTVTVLGRAD